MFRSGYYRLVTPASKCRLTSCRATFAESTSGCRAKVSQASSADPVSAARIVSSSTAFTCRPGRWSPGPALKIDGQPFVPDATEQHHRLGRADHCLLDRRLDRGVVECTAVGPDPDRVPIREVAR